MIETTIQFHDGSSVVTTDPVDFDVLKKLMDNQTKCFYKLSSEDGMSVQTGEYIITGIEQTFNRDN